jgi:hypothetical protein
MALAFVATNWFYGGIVVKITMYRRSLLALAGLALGLAAASGQAPAPIYTKNSALRLPVQLDERTRSEVAEIKLYVRGPTGTWECVKTSPASQTAFDYRAPTDGEYCFTFVTVDRRGNATPRAVESATPHRVVVVDSTPPAVTARFSNSKNSGPCVECQIQDANPDLATLRAMYLSPDNTWQPLVAVSADNPTTFTLPTQAVIENKIRVSVADRAGNRTERDIDLTNPPTLPPLAAKTQIDNGRPDPTLMSKDLDPVVSPPAMPDSRGATYPDLPKAPKPDMPAVPMLPDIKMPDSATDTKLPPVPNIKIPDAPVVTIPNDPPPPGIPGARTPAESLKLPEIPDIAPPTAKSPVDLPPPPPVMPASRNTSSAMKPSELPPPVTAEKTLGSHPVLNTRTCTINYQLDGGARLTNRIDFWASADGGRSWTKMEDAARGVSPAKLTLPGDGVYGIRIRPGGGNRPPEPGEDPDCVVEIDTTNPAVNLLPPTFSSEEGTMILNWTASDKNLLSNAINLYWSLKPEGPWNVIVSGYKNEGVYRWTLPASLNGPVYLRLEAMDRAGNIGRVELPSPVELALGKQRVKVIGVGPGQ